MKKCHIKNHEESIRIFSQFRRAKLLWIEVRKKIFLLS